MAARSNLFGKALRRFVEQTNQGGAEALVRKTLANALAPYGLRSPTMPQRSAASLGGRVSEAVEPRGLQPAVGAMLDRLAAFQIQMPRCETTLPGHGPAVPVPEGARFEDRVFRSPAESLSYKLYVPSTAGARPLPLVVMLHGCTQSLEDFAAGTRMNDVAEEQGFLVAYPRQTLSANLQKCWNWFERKDQRRDRGEPALIAGLTRDIIRDFGADATRVYVAGLSAGGAAAAIMGQAYPDLYAAVGVHSGLAAESASDMRSAFAAMREGSRPAPGHFLVPTIVFHGERDQTVHPSNGAHVLAQAQAGTTLAVSTAEGRTPGGLGYQRTVHSDTSGRSMLELWTLREVAHAWSGGSTAGSYTDPRGPDASREMLRFFLQHAATTTPQ